jgi:hypothetical protein
MQKVWGRKKEARDGLAGMISSKPGAASFQTLQKTPHAPARACLTNAGVVQKEIKPVLKMAKSGVYGGSE